MPYPNYDHRVDELYAQYRRSPEMFTPQQIDELEELAKQIGIPFSRNPEEFSLVDIGKQAVSGFVSGLTTLPMGEEPKTVYEKISHSLGHLAGFAPSIMGGPATMMSRGLAKIGLTKASKGVAKVAASTIPVLDKISIPMIGSRYSKTLVDKALQKSGLNAYEFLKQGSKARAILQESIGLGTASTISNVWAGPDEYMNTFAMGAVAGGAFGGIGNFVSIGNRLKFAKTPKQRLQLETALTGVVGAGFLGLPAYMRDEPIESIIYETLLGGYFGYKARPAHEAEGGQFFRSMQYGNEPEIQWKPERHAKWNDFTKKAQDYVNNESVYWAKRYLNRLMGEQGAAEQAAKRAFFNVNKPLSDYVDSKTGEYNKEGVDHLNKAYQDLAYKTYKTMKTPSDAEYTAYPSAIDDYDKIVNQQDVTDDVIMTPRITNLYNRLVSMMEKDPDLKVKVKTLDLAKIIKSSFDRTKELNDPQSFLAELRTSELGGKNVDKLSNDLIKWYHQTGMEMRDAMIADIDPKGNVITYPYQGNMGGKNIGIKSKNLPIDKQGSNRYVITNIKKYYKDDKGKLQFTVHKPFDFIKNQDGEFVPVLGKKELMNLQENLWNDPFMKMNIDSGIKDKGVIHVSDFHVGTFNDGQLRYSMRDIGERIGFEPEVVRIEGKDVEYTFENLMEFSRQEMYDLYGAKTKQQQEMLKEIHDATYASNVLKEAQKFNLLDKDGLLGDNISELKSKDFYTFFFC